MTNSTDHDIDTHRRPRRRVIVWDVMLSLLAILVLLRFSVFVWWFGWWSPREPVGEWWIPVVIGAAAIIVTTIVLVLRRVAFWIPLLAIGVIVVPGMVGGTAG